MKNAKVWSWLWISLTALGTLASCSQSDPASPTPAVVQQQMQTGQWRITSFIDSGKDETAHFTGYTFQFQDNGNLTATNGSLTHTGHWSIQQDGSQDDNPDSDLDVHILFTAPADFEELSEDWHIVSQSSNRLELIHVSGGNGGTDTLTFERM